MLSYLSIAVLQPRVLFVKSGIRVRGTSNGYEAIGFRESDVFFVILFRKSNFS